MQHHLVSTDHTGAVCVLQRFLLRCCAGREPGVVVELKKRHDCYRTARAWPNSELVLGRKDVVIPAHPDEGLIAGLAAKLNRVVGVVHSSWLPGVQITLAYRCFSSRSDLFNIAEGIADIASNDQPIIVGFGTEAFDDWPVRWVRIV